MPDDAPDGLHQAGGIAPAQRCPQHLHPGPVRRGATALPAPPPEHRKPRPAASSATCSASRVLPMPGSPLSEIEPAAAEADGVEGGAQLSQLAFAADEAVAHRPRRAVRSATQRTERARSPRRSSPYLQDRDPGTSSRSRPFFASLRAWVCGSDAPLGGRGGVRRYEAAVGSSTRMP